MSDRRAFLVEVPSGRSLPDLASLGARYEYCADTPDRGEAVVVGDDDTERLLEEAGFSVTIAPPGHYRTSDGRDIWVDDSGRVSGPPASAEPLIKRGRKPSRGPYSHPVR